MIRVIGGLSLIVLISSPVFGQMTATRALEVASIRPHEGPMHTMRGFSSSGTRVTLEAYLPIYLIMEAYKLKNYQVSFASSTPQPDRIFYDIVAKAEGDGALTRDEFRPMLQTLLADRFKLRAHREMKEMPVYALVLGKNGPKFKASAPDAVRVSNHGVNGRNENMTLTKASMESLIEGIWNDFGMDRPILDKTGLKSLYDIRLEATPMYRIDDNPNAGDITVFSAVQDQLGLRLESQRGSVEVLVVDHIEKPSKN